MNEAVLLSALGVVGACVAGLIWVIKYQFHTIVPALDALRKSVEANTKTTISADAYLKKRNGRDGEMHKELIGSIKGISDKIVTTAEVTARTLAETPVGQHIEVQDVKKQIVSKKTTK